MKNIDTWKKELAVVAPILCGMTFIFANNKVNWIMTAAVIATFMHAQISNSLKESQQVMTVKSVKCYYKLNWYFGIKEVLWIVSFLMVGTYSAIVGSVLFVIYPFWRKFYRWKIKPMKPIEPMIQMFDENGIGIKGTAGEGFMILNGQSRPSQ